MNKKLKIIISALIILGISVIVAQPAFAAKGIIETNVFGNMRDDGQGCGIFFILNFVIDTAIMGIGLLATAGIIIVGIMWMTAKDNEAQLAKAKRRMVDIIVGLGVFVLFYACLELVIPGGHFNASPRCATISDAELAQLNAEEKAAQEAAQKEAQEEAASGSGSHSGSGGSGSSSSEKDADLSKWFTAMEKQFDYMKNAKYGSNYKSIFTLSKKEGTCITFVSTSLQRLGVIPKDTYVWLKPSGKITGTAASYIKKHTKTFAIMYPNKTISRLNKEGKIKKGDIVAFNVNRNKKNDASHIMVFMGFNKKKKPIFNTWGHYRALKKEHSSYANRKVNMIIRLKKTSI